MDIQKSPPGLGSIQFLSGALAGTTVQITKATTTIGREPSNDIVLTDPSVSRHHAQITLMNGGWMISKIAQQNTLMVNSRAVQQSPLNDRDAIGLGGTTCLFYVHGKVAAPANAPSLTGQQGFPDVPPIAMSPWPQAAANNAPAPPAAAIFSPTVEAGPARARGGRPPAGAVELPAGRAGTVPQGEPSLEISSNIHREKNIYRLLNGVINIGRHPSNDIVINEPVVSAFHAQVVREGDKLIFVHPHPQQQRTTNGIIYMGRAIPGSEPFRKPLERGDIFRIGDEHGTLVTLTYYDGSTTVQDVLPEIRPIPLGAPLISLGRYPDNTVVLNHPQVSSHHAQLQLVQGGYRILDMDSTNGVYVNSLRIHSQQLKPGDEIRIGPFKLTYTGSQLTQHDESNSVRIDALQLRKVGNKQTILLNDITLAIPPRKFVALVGGSGTGKSTLMDALNGLRPAQSGTVLYNGQNYYKNLAAFSTQLGYVPQDDIIHRDLTVERALYYAARLRLPSDFTNDQIQQRINEVLEDVEMSFRRKLLVSKLSGGQRKRVSIALELLANPSVFFLDEPTSGLDPGLDRKMMFLLRKLADKGHTIVLVTHATNNINVCDYVCFLAQGGRLAYFGPPNEAKTYFDKTDFAEIYSALEPTEQNQNTPVEAEARFKASPYYQRYVATPIGQGPAGRANVLEATVEVSQPRRGNPWKQFFLLSTRYLELLKNDRGNLLILLLQAPIIALILFFLAAPDVFAPTNIATCPPNPQIPQTAPSKFDCQNVVNALNTPQGQATLIQRHLTRDQAIAQSIAPGSGGDAQKILFIMAFAAVMFGTINGAREIVKEEPIYRRERTVNLGIAPYMFSKIAVLGVLCLLQSAILVIVVNLKAPIRQGIFLPPTIEVYTTMALTSLAGLMLGLTISALSPNNDRATSFIPIILIPQVIFSGIIFALNNPGLQALGSFFAIRWAMAALGSSLGLHGDKLGSGGDFAYQGTLFSKFSQEQAIAHLFLMWLALVIMIIALGLLTAYFLKRKDARR
jgi:ABC-type multidrug transport system ATPase subunit/pSer/pThr/pTyr-binding forkhead associated (FHA) protein